MAAAFTLDIQDQASVNAWTKRAEALNEKAARIVREAMNILQEFKATAAGQIFDNVVECSNKVIEGVNKILEGMRKILEGVQNFMKTVMSKIKEVVSDVVNVRKNVIGS